MKKNATSECHTRPPMSPLPSAKHIWARIALTGVLYLETLANQRGKEPLRPIPYHMRVPTFAVARHTANTEEAKATRMNHHTGPQSLCARARPGRSEDFTIPSMLFTPKPVMMPQNVNTRKAPRMMIESITDRGVLRLGSLVSSASGAAASHPVRPWTPSTIASAKPDRAGMFPGLRTAKENPPGPGL